VDDPKLGYDQIQSVTVEDSSTVSVKLSAPNSPLVWGMVPYVLPRHLLAQEPIVASAQYWLRPVGTGSYKVLESTPGETALLSPADGKGVRLRVVFAQTTTQAQQAYGNADAAAWIGAPETQTAPGESVVATSSGVWRGWFFKNHSGSVWSNPENRTQVLSLIPSENATAIPRIDPFGLPHAPRTLLTTASVANHFKEEGWRQSRGGRLRVGRADARLSLLFPTPNEANFDWFMGIQQSLTSVGFLPIIRKADPPNVGGYLDGDWLTRVSGADDFDFGYTRAYFGWPTGAGWPFLSSDAPSWKNPYGGNVFNVREPRLDASYRKVLAAGDPASAESAWRETGRELKSLGIVSWEYPEPNRIRFKGVDGVRASAYTVTALESAPRWRAR
jgi:ABC-type transport system substrate-binding protein